MKCIYITNCMTSFSYGVILKRFERVAVLIVIMIGWYVVYD